MEVIVEDTAKIDALKSKVERLKTSLEMKNRKLINLKRNIMKSKLQIRRHGEEGSSALRITIQTQENNDVLGYWLSNASTLLRTLKARGAVGMAPQRRRSSSAALFGRMTQSFCATLGGVNLSLSSSGMNGGMDALRQFEAKLN
ncbi:hypothetical protein Ahy_A05g024138 [Arachis hypogaea]|uniref:Uncharacterized protein n=1 Tax=Arachis hypogaea TaxID=3818 RepID=A0A445D576_ARAHY|nr:hypothetical protein Ahy_A05g024138 [Arachis hypogaea]